MPKCREQTGLEEGQVTIGDGAMRPCIAAHTAHRARAIANCATQAPTAAGGARGIVVVSVAWPV